MLALLFVALSFFASPSHALRYSTFKSAPYNVSYNSRSLLLNGEPFLALSGSIHYPRATPAMWPALFAKAKENNLNTIQTYVFWNIHETSPGVYNFTGRRDLELFVQAAAAADLFVTLRIGPYVCSEWDYGGLPAWLNQVPGMELRTYNAPFITHMAGWVKEVVALVRPYFADKGGPIILTQIENEYSASTPEDNEYVAWLGEFVQSLDTPVPWIMCNGAAANNTIETCNACDCEEWVSQHAQSHPGQPAFWTENWLGWIQRWGYATSVLTPENLTAAVARFVGAGGSLNNYYMWFSGNNYDITAGSSVTTRYGDEPPLRADGAYHEPLYTHVGLLHATLDAIAPVLLGQKPPAPKVIFNNIKTYEYAAVGSHGSVLFLHNTGSQPATFTVSGVSVSLLPSAVAIVQPPSLLFNSGVVGPPVHTELPPKQLLSLREWKWWADPDISTLPQYMQVSPTPLEQLALTKDTSEYLFYSFTLQLSPGTHNLSLPTTTASSFVVFVDGVFIDEANDHSHGAGNLTLYVTFPYSKTATANILLLSVSLGIPNYFDHHHLLYKGLVDTPRLNGKPISGTDYTMFPKTPGEWLGLPSGQANVTWSSDYIAGLNQPRTWWTTTFATPAKEDWQADLGLHLNLTGFHRGHAWINGYSLGKFWMIIGSCSGDLFCEQWDSTTCGLPTQEMYHIPPDWLKAEGEENTVVLYEELGCMAPTIGGVWARLDN